jgi:DNA polymerase I-like protein with 3'-5' exonuclease and polymerase domains
MIRQKIAIIDKAPSKTDYSKYFNFEFDHYHMSSVPVPKLLKKDVDLVVDLGPYDLVILVGSEAAKHYAKVTSVVNYGGLLVDNKYVCITNPAMLVFKPEGKQAFEAILGKIHKYVEGTLSDATLAGDFKGINTEEEAYSFLLEVLNSNADAVALDTETSSLVPRRGYILGVSISYKPKHGRYILTDVLTDRCLELLQQVCDRYQIVFHNLKFDYKFMEYHLNLKFREPKYLDDTMLMHYILDENGSHSLKDLAVKYTEYGDYDTDLDEFKVNYCKTHGIKQEDFTYDLIPYEIISVYAACDTGVTLELYFKFRAILDKNPRLRQAYDTLMLPGIVFLKEMEEHGVPLSIPKLKAAGDFLDKEITSAKANIFTFDEIKRYEADNGPINLNSVQQLRKLLFDYIGLTPTGKVTATGAISTDAEVLEELAEEHPVPAAILKVRQLTKLQNTYVIKLLQNLDRDNKVRTNFNLSFTTSGRLSSSGAFNAQTMPRDNPIIKACIEAPIGYKIVSQDLRTAEVYYAAVLSQDKNLQAVFQTGGDLHSTIAKMVFDLPCAVEDVKKLFPKLRQAAKAIK